MRKSMWLGPTTQATYLTLAANIVNTVIATAAYRAEIEATQQLIELQKEQVDIAEVQAQAGTVPYSNVLSLQSQLASYEATIPQFEQKLAQSDDLLAALAGHVPAEWPSPSIRLERSHLARRAPGQPAVRPRPPAPGHPRGRSHRARGQREYRRRHRRDAAERHLERQPRRGDDEPRTHLVPGQRTFLERRRRTQPRRCSKEARCGSSAKRPSTTISKRWPCTGRRCSRPLSKSLTPCAPSITMRRSWRPKMRPCRPPRKRCTWFKPTIEAGIATYLDVLLADTQFHQAQFADLAGDRHALSGHRRVVRCPRRRLVEFR